MQTHSFEINSIDYPHVFIFENKPYFSLKHLIFVLLNEYGAISLTVPQQDTDFNFFETNEKTFERIVTIHSDINNSKIMKNIAKRVSLAIKERSKDNTFPKLKFEQIIEDFGLKDSLYSSIKQDIQTILKLAITPSSTPKTNSTPKSTTTVPQPTPPEKPSVVIQPKPTINKIILYDELLRKNYEFPYSTQLNIGTFLNSIAEELKTKVFAIYYKVTPETTIGEVKRRIKNSTFIQVEKLFSNNSPISDLLTIGALNIPDNHSFQAITVKQL